LIESKSAFVLFFHIALWHFKFLLESRKVNSGDYKTVMMSLNNDSTCSQRIQK